MLQNINFVRETLHEVGVFFGNILPLRYAKNFLSVLETWSVLLWLFFLYVFLGLPICLFCSVFSKKILYGFLMYTMWCQFSRPSLLLMFDHPTNTCDWEVCKLLTSSLCNFLLPSVVDCVIENVWQEQLRPITIEGYAM